MNPLLVFSGLIVLVAVGFYQVNQYHMKSFQIDYSNVPGKVVVVTGANSGLGYETSKEILRHGGRVIMACRDLKRGNAAKDNILAEIAPHDHKGSFARNVQVLPLDLSSFASIRTFVTLLKEEAKISKIDILVNNAGIMALPERTLTEDGIEAQIGTNHFGHFLLTMLVWPMLADDARIVNHSSVAHLFHEPQFPFVDPLSKEEYDAWVAYGNSKMANLLFTNALQAKINALPAGAPHKNVRVLAVHPGYSATNLQTGKFPLSDMANSLFAMSAADGALSQTFAAVDPRASATPLKKYIGPYFLSFGVPTAQTPLTTLRKKPEAEEVLWKLSVELTGADLPFGQQ